jgi:hypothetical protein
VANPAAIGCKAPIPAVRRTTIEPSESTRSGHSLVLFDDLVGAGEDRLRNRQAERLGGVEIDDELSLDRRLGIN